MQQTKNKNLTEDQIKDTERLRRYIEKNGLTSQLNDTKWKKLIEQVGKIPGYDPKFRVKCLRDSEDPPENQWEGSFPYHVPLFNHIEWLELRPYVLKHHGALLPDKRENFKEEIKGALSRISIPFVETKTGIRIVAYTGLKNENKEK